MSPFNPDPQNRYPSPRSDSGQSRDDERVIEAEIYPGPRAAAGRPVWRPASPWP